MGRRAAFAAVLACSQLLLLLSPSPAASGAVYSAVSNGDLRYTLSVDGASGVERTASVAAASAGALSSTLSVSFSDAASASWLQTPLDVSSSTALPSYLQGVANFSTLTASKAQRIGPFLYHARWKADVNSGVYFGGSSAANTVYCSFGRLWFGFSCWSNQTMTGPIVANFSTSTVQSVPSGTVAVEAAAADGAVRDLAVSLLLFRLQDMHDMVDLGRHIYTANADRAYNSQVYTGVIYCFIAVALHVACLLCALFNAYFFPLFYMLSLRNNALAWFLCLLVLTEAVGIGGGFGGALAVFILYILYAAGAGIAYGVLHCRARLKSSSSVMPSPSEDAAAAAADPNATEMGTARDSSRRDLNESGASEVTLSMPQSQQQLQPAGGAVSISSPKALQDSTAKLTSPGSEAGAGAGGSSPKGRRWPARNFDSARWSRYPTRLRSFQARVMLGLVAGFIVCVVLELGVFFGWQPTEYNLWEQSQRVVATEFAPGLVGKSTIVIYAHPRLATVFQLQWFVKVTTDYCGQMYDKPLTSDADKRQAIYDDYIVLYKIDMSDFARKDYSEFSTVNDWFTRELAPGARPIAQAADEYAVVSPADARLMAFENWHKDLHIWLKNEEFDVGSLLGDSSLASYFDRGTFLAVRLAPADYHRFHSPVNGTIRDPWKVLAGPLWSVNADAVTSENYVYFNQRKVAIIDSPVFGKVAYVAIGATCVGSVVINDDVQGPNVYLPKGHELGIMKFGGSTVVVLFREGVLKLDPEILYNSLRKVETRVLMGQYLGSYPGR